jgi:hypothetical protein
MSPHASILASSDASAAPRFYAKCLDGGDALIRQRVHVALGHADAGTGTQRGHE